MDQILIQIQKLIQKLKLPEFQRFFRYFWANFSLTISGLSPPSLPPKSANMRALLIWAILRNFIIQ